MTSPINSMFTSVVPLCSDQQFGCNDPTCVSLDKVCDFENDCTDGEDEDVCGEFRVINLTLKLRTADHDSVERVYLSNLSKPTNNALLAFDNSARNFDLKFTIVLTCAALHLSRYRTLTDVSLNLLSLQDPARLKTVAVGSQTLKMTHSTGPGTLLEMRSSIAPCLLTTLYQVGCGPDILDMRNTMFS